MFQNLTVPGLLKYQKEYHIDHVAVMPLEIHTDRDNKKIINLAKKNKSIKGLFWIQKNQINKVLSIAMKAHKILGCKGVTRSDFKFFKNKFYLLEINTQPGMTKLSLVPEIAAYKGINFLNLLEWILKDASINR